MKRYSISSMAARRAVHDPVNFHGNISQSRKNAIRVARRCLEFRSKPRSTMCATNYTCPVSGMYSSLHGELIFMLMKVGSISRLGVFYVFGFSFLSDYE